MKNAYAILVQEPEGKTSYEIQADVDGSIESGC
jgi:hypothetical protein